MANRRLAFATVLAGIALALALSGMVGGSSLASMQMEAGHASLAASHFGGLSAGHVPGLIALASAIGAFILSWRQRSYLVASLLVGAGFFYTIHLAPFLGDHDFIAFPGPVVGLFFGHVMMALGLAKGIISAKARLVQTPNK